MKSVFKVINLDPREARKSEKLSEAGGEYRKALKAAIKKIDKKTVFEKIKKHCGLNVNSWKKEFGDDIPLWFMILRLSNLSHQGIQRSICPEITEEESDALHIFAIEIESQKEVRKRILNCFSSEGKKEGSVKTFTEL